MKIVLVTGGASFIGSHIVDLLLKTGYEPIIIDNLSTGEKENIPKNITMYKMDILSSEVINVFSKEKPDYVIHQAAQVDVTRSMKSPLTDASVNIMGTLNLLKYCKTFKIKKFIYASTSAVYGNTSDCSITEYFPIQPISYYGVSKHSSELYIKLFHHQYHLPYTILRYANVYGPRQTPKGEGGVISIFIKKLLKSEIPIIFGDGNQTRDFIYVKDVANANIRSLSYGDNKVINISRNEKVTINELYHKIISLIPGPSIPSY
ncbi:NAD-dependent epimerase/dehydratase family protein [Alkalihalobacillus sp. BA299]|uniref:NAD-dependent epimerase/dehydratase family protein n=1 Tax=Alkalihalobacillus sp. BA299 TaxID=2815938 RepID=UPI0027DD1F33|nr:NAD-dependent epimerase/dehydratase family protein [Alkalihalobacillus sp. BA299]